MSSLLVVLFIFIFTSLSVQPHQQFISLLSKLLIYQCYDVTALQRSLQTGSCRKRPLHIYSFHLQIVLSTKVKFPMAAELTALLTACCHAAALPVSLQRSDSSEWFCLNGGMKPTSNRDYSTPCWVLRGTDKPVQEADNSQHPQHVPNLLSSSDRRVR